MSGDEHGHTSEARPDWKQRHEAQTRALASIGFGESFPGGDWMSPTFAECNLCGAVVRIVPTATEDQPAIKHHRWHAEAQS